MRIRFAYSSWLRNSICGVSFFGIGIKLRFSASALRAFWLRWVVDKLNILLLLKVIAAILLFVTIMKFLK